MAARLWGFESLAEHQDLAVLAGIDLAGWQCRKNHTGLSKASLRADRQAVQRFIHPCQLTTLIRALNCVVHFCAIRATVGSSGALTDQQKRLLFLEKAMRNRSFGA